MNKKVFIFLIIFLNSIAFVPVNVSAQQQNKCPDGYFYTVFGCIYWPNSSQQDPPTTPLESLVENLIDIANIAIPVIAITMLMVAGFIWAGSSGNPEGIKIAKDIILTTILAVAAYLLLRILLFRIIYGPDKIII